MFDNEKDSILAVGFTLILIGAITLFWIASSKIPLAISFLILVAVLLVYIQPTFYKRYYNFLDRKADFTRFIPVYNEIGLFSKFYARLYMITLVVLAVAVMTLLLMDINVVANLFGDELAFRFPTIMLSISALALIVFCFVRGLAYMQVFNVISYNLYKLGGKENNSSNGLEKAISAIASLLMFLPVVRGIGMLSELRMLNNLARVSLTRRKIRNLNDSEVTYK